MSDVIRLLSHPRTGRLAALAVAMAFPLVTSNRYHLFLVTAAGIYLLASQGLNLLLGYCGQLSLAHGAIVGVGAYGVGILTIDHGWSFWAATLVSVLAATAIGTLLVLPALRLTSWYFALVTLVFALAFEGLLVELRNITGGFAGKVGVPRVSLFDYELTEQDFYWLVVAFNLVAFLIVRSTIRSRLGPALVGVRDGSNAVAAAGISATRTKVFAFAVSAAFAGIAGGLFAVQKAVVTPDDFNLHFSILFLAIVVVGGAGSLWGPILGVLAFYLLPDFLTWFEEWRILVFGVGLIMVMLFAPDGMSGLVARGWNRLVPNRETRPRDGRGSVPSDSPVGTEATYDGAALEFDDVAKHFGGVIALHGIDLRLEAGLIHGIVGPNGSGKTTLLNLISGYYKPTTGRIRVADHQVTGTSPWRIARGGVARTFQTPSTLPELTVVENVIVGAYSSRAGALGPEILGTPGARRQRGELEAQARSLLRFVDLPDSDDVTAGELTHGQQRLVEIARALMARPRVLLLDEPAAGLSMSELDRLEALIARLGEHNLTVLLVEHHIEMIAGVCDDVLVLDQGGVIIFDRPSVVFEDERVGAAYMGSTP